MQQTNAALLRAAHSSSLASFVIIRLSYTMRRPAGSTELFLWCDKDTREQRDDSVNSTLAAAGMIFLAVVQFAFSHVSFTPWLQPGDRHKSFKAVEPF